MTTKKEFPYILSRKINIVLVGCGRISKNHLKAIFNSKDDAKLVGLCDNNSENLETTLSNLKELAKDKKFTDLIEIFNSYESLISKIKSNKIKVDLIVLATPSGLHSNQVKMAASIGVNVCTEKPMATKYSEGKEMIQACKLANVRLFVVKQNRFNDTLQLVKRQLDKNRFGFISLVTVNVFWQRPQSYYDLDSWRGTWEFDGGALMNQASHYVDLLSWMIGPLDNISASTSTVGRTIEVENNAAIQMKFMNGAIGTMAVSMNAFPKNLEGSITILGEKGSVRIGGTAVNKIDFWEFLDKDEDDLHVEDVNYRTKSVYGNGHIPFYKNMLSSLKGIEEPICDGSEGLKSLEILEAAYESARLKKVINLPL
tara:strand:+ start:8217 stop:9326 length:1110 start_codon:yes stop_codon:yes gene_type:complete